MGTLAAPDFYAGSNDPRQSGPELINRAGWIRRLCNEITNSNPKQTNVGLIYRLIEMCFLFRDEGKKWTDDRFAGVINVIALHTTLAGLGNPEQVDLVELAKDYNDLYEQAGACLEWGAKNLPQEGRPIPDATVTVFRAWPSPDFIITIEAPPALLDQVDALLAIFA